MKRTICLLITAILLLSGCNLTHTNNNEQTELVDTGVDSPVSGKKTAYILNMPSSDIFDLCANQCIQTAQKLGMTCDVFYSHGDDETFKNQIENCAENGYDGLYLSHGGEDYSYDFLSDLLKEYPDLKIVTFDTQFKDENGETQTIDGVTQFFQDDAGLAEELLNYTCTELYPEKSPVNILKVWIPNYIAPFDRREIGYKKYEDEGKINTVEVIAPKDYSNAGESVYDVMKETLAKYSEDDIDAVWAAYDVYAQGCYRAIEESGLDIPVVSVDLSNTDIQCMIEEGSCWKACACTDFKANGEQGIRILALELNGDYGDIKAPKTGVATNYLEMPASLITQDMLKEDTTIENIYDVAPEQYGDVENYVTNDWLKACIGY